MPSKNPAFKIFAVVLAVSLAALLIAYRQYNAVPPRPTHAASDDPTATKPATHETFGGSKSAPVVDPNDVAPPALQTSQPASPATTPAPAVNLPTYMRGSKSAGIAEPSDFKPIPQSAPPTLPATQPVVPFSFRNDHASDLHVSPWSPGRVQLWFQSRHRQPTQTPVPPIKIPDSDPSSEPYPNRNFWSGVPYYPQFFSGSKKGVMIYPQDFEDGTFLLQLGIPAKKDAPITLPETSPEPTR